MSETEKKNTTRQRKADGKPAAPTSLEQRKSTTNVKGRQQKAAAAGNQ